MLSIDYSIQLSQIYMQIVAICWMCIFFRHFQRNYRHKKKRPHSRKCKYFCVLCMSVYCSVSVCEAFYLLSQAKSKQKINIIVSIVYRFLQTIVNSTMRIISLTQNYTTKESVAMFFFLSWPRTVVWFSCFLLAFQLIVSQF